MTQNKTGWVLVAVAFALLAQNMADSIADLQDWHGATTTQFFAVLLKQSASVTLAALGGKMTNSFGGSQP